MSDKKYTVRPPADVERPKVIIRTDGDDIEGREESDISHAFAVLSFLLVILLYSLTTGLFAYTLYMIMIVSGG